MLDQIDQKSVSLVYTGIDGQIRARFELECVCPENALVQDKQNRTYLYDSNGCAAYIELCVYCWYILESWLVSWLELADAVQRYSHRSPSAQWPLQIRCRFNGEHCLAITMLYMPLHRPYVTETAYSRGLRRAVSLSLWRARIAQTSNHYLKGLTFLKSPIFCTIRQSMVSEKPSDIVRCIYSLSGDSGLQCGDLTAVIHVFGVASDRNPIIEFLS